MPQSLHWYPSSLHHSPARDPRRRLLPPLLVLTPSPPPSEASGPPPARLSRCAAAAPMLDPDSPPSAPWLLGLLPPSSPPGSSLATRLRLTLRGVRPPEPPAWASSGSEGAPIPPAPIPLPLPPSPLLPWARPLPPWPPCMLSTARYLACDAAAGTFSFAAPALSLSSVPSPARGFPSGGPVVASLSAPAGRACAGAGLSVPLRTSSTPVAHPMLCPSLPWAYLLRDTGRRALTCSTTLSATPVSGGLWPGVCPWPSAGGPAAPRSTGRPAAA